MWTRITLVAVLAVALALTCSDGARAKNHDVYDGASLAAALSKAKKGETIRLADGLYPAVEIRDARSLTIIGSRGARVAGVSVKRSTGVTLSGFTITPPADARAVVSIDQSSDVLVDSMLFDGRDEHVGAGLTIGSHVTGVTVRRSEFTNCGWGTRCVDPSARDMLVVANSFHDCLDCDFIRGGAQGILIRGNTFDRAIPGACQGGTLSCPHNDHVQIMSGGPWTIVGNRFGERKGGAASVFVNPGLSNTSNPVQNVTIASNVFTDPNGNYGVHIGDNKGGDLGLIRNVRIVNNTILAGNLAAVRVNREWVAAPPEQRPVVANNILRFQRGGCDSGRFSANLVLEGEACPEDEVGPAHLDASGAPTDASALVIDRGRDSDAPTADFFGRGRKGKADRGAIEFGADRTVEPPPWEEKRKKKPRDEEASEPVQPSPPPSAPAPAPADTPAPAPSSAARAAAAGQVIIRQDRKQFVVSLLLPAGTVTGSPDGEITCAARFGTGREIGASRRVYEDGAAVCAWRLGRDHRGLRARGTIRVKNSVARAWASFNDVIR